MIRTLVYEHQKFGREIQFEEISEIIKEPRNLVFVDAEKPTDDEMAQIAKEFDFHPLSVEDVMHGHQRPKIDEYTGYYYLVGYALRYDKENLSLEMVEIDFFIGRNYVVTVHHDQCHAIEQALGRVHQHPKILEEGVGFLVYALMDTVIDDYMPILDDIDEQVDAIEESVFQEFKSDSISTIFRLKREMLKIRRNVGHMRDVFNILARRDQPMFSPQTVVYFQDIYDHLYRITDAVDIYRDVLTGALEAYISLNGNKLNEVMKVFAGLSIMLMTAALIAGIYGMNFKNMPELDWYWGYPGAIILMLVLSIFEFWWFRRKKWL